ncbi:MAG: ribonuclease R [Alphaproteobacteria bacterium]|nr:ribonuclease R [Alphaproteobacteria bacterium]
MPSKRDIAKAFNIRGDDRVVLKDMLREMKKKGELPGSKPKPLDSEREENGVVIMEVVGFDPSGTLMVQTIDRKTQARDEDAPQYALQYKDEAPFPGERVLVKTNPEKPNNRKAILLKVMPEKMTHVLGIFHGVGEHGTVEPVNRKIKEEFAVLAEHTLGAKEGELVYCKLTNADMSAPRRNNKRHMLRPVEVVERIGRMENPRSASLIAIQNQDIPMEFSPEAIRIAETASAPTLTKGREDLRDVNFVTIDGADARDFDDAVWAEPHGDGWHLMVAIADVAHYVRFGTALDNEAFLRGNSVYFPDRVVPMLPEALSNGLCSLVPNEDRFCIAVHLWIDAKGNTSRYKFVRGIMRSKARLTYDQAQAAHDGEEGVVAPEIYNNTIKHLYGVYKTLNKNRLIRGALELDLPEHKVVIDEQTGQISEISLRERYDSHKLIEECMICANVAAAHAIETADAPGMFRVHEEPDIERVNNLRSLLKQLGYSIANQEKLSSHHFNTVIKSVEDKPESHVIHMAILRSQMAAYYHPENLGHFGLALEQYCHYTSPIRRYSDLIVHRSLIDICSMCDKETDGLVFEQAENLNSIATHISQTERRAMLAEREARERYLTNYMAEHTGKEFDAVIAGVNSFGFFVELRENGAQGLVPARNIDGDYWIFDKEHQRLVGRRTGEEFRLGQRVRVILLEADTLTGSMRFGLVGREVAHSNASNYKGKKKPYTGKGAPKKNHKNKNKKFPSKASGQGKPKKPKQTHKSKRNK